MKCDLIIGLYVDDIMITGGFSEVEGFIDEFQKHYKSRLYKKWMSLLAVRLSGIKIMNQ